MQDTYVRALKKIDTLERPDQFRTWITSIGIREALQLVRRTKPAQSLSNEMVELGLADSHGSPEDEAIRHEEDHIVDEALETLTPDERLLLLAHYRDDVPLADISTTMNSVLDVPLEPYQVKGHMHRARLHLKSSLESRLGFSNPRSIPPPDDQPRAAQRERQSH